MTNAKHQALVSPRGLRHVRKRGDDIGFAVGIPPANQEAARVVTGIAGGCGWLPGGAKWLVP
ncbi:MAG TPA: hypothetical protein VGS80_19810 [Ktedonobacterales bacterium]|nr:hypothetical protein [Ktedonobacterales bacterium]